MQRSKYGYGNAKPNAQKKPPCVPSPVRPSPMGPAPVAISEAQTVTIDYTNYRGERSSRQIQPLRVHFSSGEWHPEPQWILDAFDLSRGAERSFAMKDIHSWNQQDQQP